MNKDHGAGIKEQDAGKSDVMRLLVNQDLQCDNKNK